MTLFSGAVISISVALLLILSAIFNAICGDMSRVLFYYLGASVGIMMAIVFGGFGIALKLIS